MTRFFNISAIFINIVHLTLVYKKINASDVSPDKNEQAAFPMNECTLITDLVKIGLELRNFIGDKTNLEVHNPKGFSVHQEDNKAVFKQNYLHFETAQVLIIETSNKLNPKSIHSDEDMDRNEKIQQLLELSKKLLPGSLMHPYTHVLEFCHVAYLKINQLSPKFIDSAISKEFISALVILHNKVHMLTYIQISKTTDIQVLLDLDYQNFIQENKLDEQLKNMTLGSFMIQNYYTLAKLLILAYKYQVNWTFTPLYNPIIIGLEILKTPDISIFNIEKVAIVLLDKLLVLLLNDAGIGFINSDDLNTLFYYSESSESIVAVDYTKYILSEKKTRTDEYYLDYAAYIDPFHAIEIIYEVFSFNSKQQIATQIFHLLLISCEDIEYKIIKYTWVFVLDEYIYLTTTTLYRDEILNFLSEKLANVSTQKNDYYEELCHLTIYKNIWCLYKIYIKGMSTYKSLKFVILFLDIVRCMKSQDSNKFYIFKNQLKLLHELLDEIINNECKDEFLKELLGIYDFIIERSYNICSLYNSTEDPGYINSTLGSILNIHTLSILYFDVNVILTHIENLLSSRNISCFLPLSKKAIDISFSNLTSFLHTLTGLKDETEKGLSDRIANISLLLFFILIDLQVTLKQEQSFNANSEYLEIIINHLRKREFEKLKFETYSHKMPNINYSKSVKSWPIYYEILMENIGIINIIHNKQSYKSIEVIIIDVIQIRLRLPQGFINLIQLNAYNLILVSKTFKQLSMNDSELDDIIQTQTDFNDNILYDEVITNTFPLQPKNTYELCVYTFLDVFCTIQRFKFANKILASRLDKIIIDLNALDRQLCAVDFQNLAFFPEKWTIFVDLYNAINDLASLPSNSTKTPSFYIEFLSSPLKSIQDKLKDMIEKNNEQG